MFSRRWTNGRYKLPRLIITFQKCIQLFGIHSEGFRLKQNGVTNDPTQGCLDLSDPQILVKKVAGLKGKTEKTFSFLGHELLLNWCTMQQQKGLLHFWPLLLDTFLPAEQIDVHSFIQAAFRPDFVRHLIFIRIKIWWETTSGRSDQSNHKIAANVLLASNFASPKNPQNHAVALVGSRLAGSGRSSNIQP